MTKALIPYTPEEDYTCYPRLIPGDWFYEKLKVENPRKLKRLMREEQQLYRETSTPEYQQQMHVTDLWAKLSIEHMRQTGELQKYLNEGYRLLAMKGQADPASSRLVLGFADDNKPLTKREVKNAYRRQARKLHPDKGGDAEAFKAMYAAYRTLLALAKD